MKKLLLILVLVAFSNPSIAAEKDYTMCSITGYLIGNEEKFVAGIAMRIITETGVLETKRGTFQVDPICDALMEKGIRIGKADLKRGRYNLKNMDEMRIGVDAGKFKDKVYDVTISGMEK
tara:strand:+ start:1239 stop:1598 length:360 start_codon:yes stop_codon:yes gene_type:complete